MNKFFLKTHGCQMNEYDSGRIADLLLAGGEYSRAESADDATLLILNTCSIRENARNKVFSGLGRWRTLKERNPQLIIAVAGCIPSQEGEQVFQLAPFVDIVFGPQTLHKLPQFVAAVKNGEGRQIDVSFPEMEKFDCLPQPSTKGGSAYLTIMEGCNNYCDYCVVPYTRGREYSRPFADVITEVESLIGVGVKEINFLGQNVNAYRGENGAAQANLADIIRKVAEYDEIERIRFTTSHPKWFDNTLIDAYADIPKLANHLHLPVQSGSDNILKAMGRGYAIESYRDKVAALREVRPDISLSSDFIVGFPGESLQDHEQTLQLVRDIGFDNSYSFAFSSRPGTKADRLDDDVSLAEKKRRLLELQELLSNSAAAISAARMGTVQQVLVNGESKRGNGQLTGRTECNRVVNFSGSSDLIGNMVAVKIDEVLSNSLRGVLI